MTLTLQEQSKQADGQKIERQMRWTQHPVSRQIQGEETKLMITNKLF